jgi:23S rRNA (uracil1939-C5)-methyltransferase
MSERTENLKVNEVIKNLDVVDMSVDGFGIGRHRGRAVFIRNGVPGDSVELRVRSIKKGIPFGEIITFNQFSKSRVKHFCEHFIDCGGCKMQHISYDEQLQIKERWVKNALERIGKIDCTSLKPIIGSELTRYYRNKLEFTFSNRKWLTKSEMESEEMIQRNALGFHVPRHFDKILDIDRCYLQNEEINQIRNGLRELAIRENISFYDLKKHTGCLRNVVFRTTTTNDLMVIVQFAYVQQTELIKVMEYLSKGFKTITSLNYVINTKRNDTMTDQEVIHYSGESHITEVFDEIKFRISPKSFFQTNPGQALKLYRKVREIACLNGRELVYDLYTGTGSIAQFIASKCREVIGIEYVEEAVVDARENSKLNNIQNTVFYSGDMAEILNEDLVALHGAPEVVITDPPRAGMHEKVVRHLLHLEPKKIVYVSCNPATQARDIAILLPKYEVKQIQPIDMFPHTMHVENVILLELRKGISTNVQKI